jgi:membrane-bound serine protease (ClpP class)
MRKLLVLLLLFWTLPGMAKGVAVQLEIDGALGVATAEYIIDGIDAANAQNANLVIIRMDTPGGLMEPMRDIIQTILNSSVPVVTYVSPGGARADSAGTYILLASHIAAMAPTTHLGAATPVSLTGGDADEKPDPTPRPPGVENADDADDADDAEEPAAGESSTAMERKVLNDAIAYIRGLADSQGRNADWAENAVRNAATLTAKDALEKNVIDVIASDVDELLEAINGREVNVNNEKITIESEGITVETVEPNWRIKFLRLIANPQVLLLLIALGTYGLLFEGYNPGAIYPGVVGIISILLAAYALQVLPVNYAGLALIIVGFALILAEAFVPSFGALGIGGIAAFVFGSIMMFDSGIPGFGISKAFVFSFAIVAGGLMFLLVTFMLKLQRRGAVSGKGSIIGGVGTAMQTFTGEGKIWLEGEAWAAVSSELVKKDQHVRVRAIDGLTLLVEPIEP